MQAYFQQLLAGLDARLKQAAPGEPIARKALVREVARLGTRLYSEEGGVAWCGVLAPFDVLHAMGLTSCFVEFVGAMLASVGAADPALVSAEDAGYSTDSCGYHRAVTGAALKGMMPVPDCLIATSAPCTGGLAVIDNLARHFDRPLYVLDIPQHDGPQAEAYLTDQLREMTDFVASHTGRSLDRERLAEAIELTNRARALLLEVYELARAVPSPGRPRDMVNFALLESLLLGTEGAVEVARIYRDELAAGAADQTREDVRLMWLQNRIQFRHPLDQLLNEELHAPVVVDELNDIAWDPIDPDDPFPGLARRMMSISLVGPVDRRVATLQRLARDYRVDGAINPCHWGCRQGTGSRGLIERGLLEVDVPVLNLEVDCIDKRSFSEGQLRTRLEAFVEMLQSRPRRAQEE